MPDQHSTELALQVLQQCLAGNLDLNRAAPVLKELLGDVPLHSLDALRHELGDDSPVRARLLADLNTRLLVLAGQAHDELLRGQFEPDRWPSLSHLPVPPVLGWTDTADLAVPARELAVLRRDLAYVDGLSEPCPKLADAVRDAYRRQLGDFSRLDWRWEYLAGESVTEPAWLAGRAVGSRERLDALLMWPGSAAADAIARLELPPDQQQYAMEALMLRFGQKQAMDWLAWRRFLMSAGELRASRLEACRRVAESFGPELAAIRVEESGPAPAEVLDPLAERARLVRPEAFLQRWRHMLVPEEAARLPGAAAVPLPVPLPEPRRLGEPATTGHRVRLSDLTTGAKGPLAPPVIRSQAAPTAAPSPPAPPPPPPEPSVWQTHVQPLLLEYWYLVAGLVLMIAGASLLAYLTWDKPAVYRYTIMPVMLLLFTGGLAELGNWLGKRHEDLRSTGLILRGGAIALLPVNAMVVAVISGRDDPNWVLAGGLSVVYLGLIGGGLWRWCGQALGRRGRLMAVALLGLNALAPLVVLLKMGFRDGPVPQLLAAGFYVAVVLAIVCVRRSLATPVEEADPPREIWFGGLTLAVTWLQMMVWTHLYLEHLPQMRMYGVLMILLGDLMFHLERHLWTERGRDEGYSGESFIGYAVVLAGVLMSMGSATARIVGLAVAGLVWLRQATRREGELHYWLGVSLVVLGAASVGTAEWFPKRAELNLLPALGIAIALAMGVWRKLAGHRDERLRACLTDFQPVVLMVTVVVAVFSQWRLGSTRWQTGAWLLAVALFFVWRALALGRLPWVHASMTLVAVALPYLGFVDFSKVDRHGNTMALGLGIVSAAWLILLQVWKQPLLRQARSTVPACYGVVALAAMVLRVLVENQPITGFADYAGPLLVAAALIVTSYLSRSLGPGIAAAAILAVLFPELKARFRETFEMIGWGSGLGSASSAAGLLALAFGLCRWPRLRELGEGDNWTTGTPFPWRRFDYTLFTIPIVGSVLFLAAKCCTVTHWRVIGAGAPGWKTVAALGICAVVWAAAAVYLKQYRASRLLPHLAWAALLLATFSGQHRVDGRLNELNLQWPLLWAGLVLQAVWFATRALRERWPDGLLILGGPFRRVLDVGSQVVAWPMAAALFMGYGRVHVQWLAIFVAAQLVWHGLRRRTYRQGAALAVLGTMLLTQGTAHPELYALWAIAGVQLVQMALETRPRWYVRLRYVVAPMQVLAVMLVLWVLWVSVAVSPDKHFWLGLVVLLAVARSQRSALLALLAAGYLCIHQEWPTEPWQLGLMALGLTGLPFAARWVHRTWAPAVAGRYPLGRFTGRSNLWWLTPGLAAGLLALGWQLAAVYLGKDDYAHEQLVALWAAPVAYVLVGVYRRSFWLWFPAGVLLAVANTVVVDLWWGPWLKVHGLSGLHTICLGLGWTLLEVSAAKEALRRTALGGPVARFGRLLAGGILVALAANYAVNRDVSAITATRLIVSGIMALLAGLYFRFELSRGIGVTDGERQTLTSLYHAGLTVAIWCLFLLIPPLRSSKLALSALAMAPIWFWIRAEWGRAETQTAYARSAEALAYLVLALYAANAAFQVIAFPELSPDTHHYHAQAPVAIAMGLLLLRQQRFLGGGWAAFYGGLALIVGGFFGITAWPGASPFDAPMAAAWAATLWTHLLTVGADRRSPLRGWVQMLGGIDDLRWVGLRRAWGRWLLAGSQLVILLGAAHYRDGSWQVTPLLLAAASVFIHQGILGRYKSYFAVAGLEVLVALHADFLLPDAYPGLIPAERVVWVILAVWVAVVVGWHVWRRWLPAAAANTIGSGVWILAFLHVLWHGPSSNVGLAVMWCLLALALVTPRETRRAANPAELITALGVLVVVAWLMFWHQVAMTGQGLTSFRAWLALAATVLAIGETARTSRDRAGVWLDSLRVGQPRVWHQVVAALDSDGRPLVLTGLWAGSALLTVLLAVAYLGTTPVRGVMLAMMVTWAALAWAWYRENHERESTVAGFMTEFAVVGAAACVRRILWTMGQWNPYYDVWVSLAVSTALSGMKQVVHRQEQSRRLPLVVSLFALPVATLVWVMWNHLGTDVALVVIGLHCVSFTWLGAGNRRSAYNVVAVMHFVAFVALLFWSRLEMRFLHAYVIPVGIGVLVLLQLHGDRVNAQTRNAVRLVTLLAMMGSSGYYVLADPSHALGFHLTMLLLCIGAMLLGGWLRVRLYLALGMAGLLLDVAVLLTRTIRQFDSSVQKMCIGIMLLGLGSVLVGGTAWYKAHREAIQERLAALKAALVGWE